MTDEAGDETSATVEIALDRYASRVLTEPSDSLEAETRAFIDHLAIRYGLTAEPELAKESSEGRDDLSEGDLESSALLDEDFDGTNDKVPYWAAHIQLLPVMDNTRHGPCSLEIEAGVIAQAVLEGEWDLTVYASDDELRSLIAIGKASLLEMLEGNLKLALFWAQRFARGDADLAQDLFQEAYGGLFRAIEGWDSLRGYAFSTYAVWHVRQTIGRAFSGGAARSPVYLPVHVLEEIRAAARDGREPSELGKLAMQWQTKVLSWEQIQEEVPDVVSLIRPSPIEELLERLCVQKSAAQCLEFLDDRSSDVLASRAGLRMGETETLDAVGIRLSVTRERVRQLELKATKRLRARVAGNDEYRGAVMAHIEENHPEVLHNPHLARLLRDPHAPAVGRQLKARNAEVEPVVDAISDAVLALYLPVSDLPEIWKITPGLPSHLMRLFTPYDPPLSLTLLS